MFFEEFSQKTKEAQGSPLEIALQIGFRGSPWTKVDWFLQIFDNTYEFYLILYVLNGLIGSQLLICRVHSKAVLAPPHFPRLG